MAKDFPRYISASQISIFLDCPLKYKKIYSEDVIKTPPNLYILFGSAIHHALEINYKQKITSRIDIPVLDAIGYFGKYLIEEAEKNLGFSVDLNLLRQLILQGEFMLSLYWKEVAPTIQPIAVEQKFEIVLETMPDVIIYGFWDLITEDGGVIDHKTTGSTTHKMWTQAYVDRMHQLTIYDLAYRKTYKKPPKYLAIDALKRLKDGPAITRIRTERSNLQILALAQLMQRMKDFQKYDLFYPNFGHCDSPCDFRDSCTRLCIE